MFSQVNPKYPHRHNTDGSYDSICSMCLLTVASVKTEHELALCERTHVCDPIRLYQLGRHPLLTGSILTY